MIRTLPCAVIAILSIGAAAASEPNPQVAGQNPGAKASVATQPAADEPSKTAAPILEHSEPAHEARGFVFADYLLWWVRRGPTPPLVTTGTGESEGVLGDPGTVVLFGTEQLDYGTFSGIRAGAGWNFGDDRFWGVEISGFALQERSRHFTAGSNANGDPLISRPFLSVVDTRESAVANSSPGEIAGNITVDSKSQLWSWDVVVVAHSVRDARRNFDLMAGFRSLGLDENLRIQENLTPLTVEAIDFQTDPTGVANIVPAPAVGSRITTLDDFETRNRFYGGQLGGRFQWEFGRLQVDLLGKIAFGVTNQRATIFGVSHLDEPGPAGRDITTTGGLLALRSNIGDFQRNQFSVVPELGVTAQVEVTSRLRARIGYTGLYWSGVARPGNQIDRAINTKLIPSGQGFVDPFDPQQEQFRPRFAFGDNGFWAHGLNFGLEFRY